MRRIDSRNSSVQGRWIRKRWRHRLQLLGHLTAIPAGRSKQFHRHALGLDHLLRSKAGPQRTGAGKGCSRRHCGSGHRGGCRRGRRRRGRGTARDERGKIENRKQDLRSHANQNGRGHIFIVVTIDDVAHFTGQYEGQGRIVQFKDADAAVDHDRAGRA